MSVAERQREYHRLLDDALTKAGFEGLTREELEGALTDTYLSRIPPGQAS